MMNTEAASVKFWKIQNLCDDWENDDTFALLDAIEGHKAQARTLADKSTCPKFHQGMPPSGSTSCESTTARDTIRATSLETKEPKRQKQQAAMQNQRPMSSATSVPVAPPLTPEQCLVVYDALPSSSEIGRSSWPSETRFVDDVAEVDQAMCLISEIENFTAAKD